MPSLCNARGWGGGEGRPHLSGVVAQNVPPEHKHEETITYAQMEGHSRQLGCLFKNVSVMKEKTRRGGAVGTVLHLTLEECNQQTKCLILDGIRDRGKSK